jgi:hypothetical protein
MDADHVGKSFLAQPTVGPQAAQISGKTMLNIHTAFLTPLSSIDLQTISHNPFDFAANQSVSVRD